MLYVDMKYNSEEGRVFHRDLSSSAPFMESHTQETTACVVSYRNGRLALIDGGDEENLFAKGITPGEGETLESIYPFVPQKEGGNKYKRQRKKAPTSKLLTYADIADTPDNPIIVVLCDEIGIYRGVEADIKFIYMGSDGILAALISGACTFNGVPLKRCSDVNLDTRTVTKVFKGEDMKSLVSATDRESGYNYLWEAVHHVKLVEKEDSKGYVGISSSSVKQGENIFETKGIETSRKFKAEEQARKDAERQRQAELNAKVLADREAREKAKKEKEQAERDEKARLAMEKKEARANGLKVANGDKVVSVGASAFLAAVRSSSVGV